MSSNTPVSGPVVANDPIAAGAIVQLSASLTDADATDTNTATWDWGDGSSNSGVVNEANGAGTVTGSHTYSAAGVYTVTLTITDNTARSVQVTRYVVVYDPSAGLVTGGGWIQSPPGAYKAELTLAGRATFGFLSQYRRGATVPTGTTEFLFRAANLNFHSDEYDWLVVVGARAQFKGLGKINGMGEYKFLLTAIDGQVRGGGGTDRFRIKIWHYDADKKQDVVVYDNQLESSLEAS